MNDREPTEEEIQKYMKDNNKSYYSAREELRDFAYSSDHEKLDQQSWGDYWKSY